MIKVFHLNRLTLEERDEINAKGWDGCERGTRYADITSFAKVDAVKEAIMLGEYSLVAEVDTDCRDEAFRLTNNIICDWQDNIGVTAKGEARFSARSTSVGDLMIDERGLLWRVANIGFKQIDGVKREALGK